jgi:hypothetical protein
MANPLNFDGLVLTRERVDELAPLQKVSQPRRVRVPQLHIGCPLEWFKRVKSVVYGKEELAVAVWLHRRRAVCQSEWFDVPNATLHKELGVNRHAKYRAIRDLERAGLIVVRRNNKRSLQVRIL